MPMLDLSQLPGGFGYGQQDIDSETLGWLNAAKWNKGAIPPGTMDDSMGAAAAQAAREAAALRLGSRKRVPMSAEDTTFSHGTPPIFGALAPDLGGDNAAPAMPAPVSMPPATGPFAAPSTGPFNVGPGDPFKMAPPMWGPQAPNMGPPPGGPENAALPPGATPTAGMPPPADLRPLTPPAPRAPMGPMGGAAPSGSLLDRVSNGLNNNSDLLLALGAGFAGAPSLGEGMHRAFTNASSFSGRNQTIDALMSRGLPQDMARAAASNPAILQQLLPGMFGPKQLKFTQIGEDMMGNKRYGFVDEVRGQTYDHNGNPISPTSGGGSSNIPVGADGMPLQGQELLTHLEKSNPEVAAALKDMHEGKLNPNARNIQKLAPMAALVYPDFDATQYPVRVALRKSYSGGGKDFQEVQALNTVSGHMGRLMDSADALDNSTFKPINNVRNWWSDHISDNPKLVRFRNDLVTTSNELAKAYHGGHVTDAAYGAFNKAINDAQTPEALKAAIGEISALLKSKIEAKESGYRQGLQGAALPEDYRALNDEAKAAYNRINDWAMGRKPVQGQASVGANPVAPSAPPAPGKYVYDPATGGLKPQ